MYLFTFSVTQHFNLIHSLCQLLLVSLSHLLTSSFPLFLLRVSHTGDSSSGADWMFYSPLIWTKAQVQSWLRWAWQQCNIPGEYDLGNLDLTGPELCVATMEELQNRSEHGGLLYEAFTKLDIPQWECK